jgi:ribose 1,5-bisphosphokinase
MNVARMIHADDATVVFARRVITREVVPGAEDHDSLTPDAFERAEAAGGFALSWRAHGLAYGIPAAIRADLGGGRMAVANVSRCVIAAAEAMGYPVAVLYVTASPEILAERIARRGRESAAGIAARLAREVPLTARKARIIEVRNETTLEAGAAAFLDALRAARHLSLAGAGGACSS